MSAPEARARQWRHATGSLRLDRPVVMAVLNVTPDSFHDGGAFSDGVSVDVDKAYTAAKAAVDAGAGILDVGGESTRPGADPVDADAERARVLSQAGEQRPLEALALDAQCHDDIGVLEPVIEVIEYLRVWHVSVVRRERRRRNEP